ncbi:ZIP Zinc transporter family protein [Aphelenchoides besseyi]|nr:ZIP Zinc transporter family protein [Aphelenchoides besseyi]
MFQFRLQNDPIGLPPMDLKLSNRGSLILPTADEKQNENIDDAHKETVVASNRRFSIVNIGFGRKRSSAAKKEAVPWKSLVFMLSLGLHSFIEGGALGVLRKRKSMLLLFSALLFHKSVESFKISLKLRDLKTSERSMLYSIVIIYCSITPFRAISTHFLLNSRTEEQIGDLIAIVLANAGTFLLHHVLRQRTRERSFEFGQIRRSILRPLSRCYCSSLQSVCIQRTAGVSHKNDIKSMD